MHETKFEQLKKIIVLGIRTDSKTDLDRIFYVDILTRLFLLRACCIQLAEEHTAEFAQYSNPPNMNAVDENFTLLDVENGNVDNQDLRGMSTYHH